MTADQLIAEAAENRPPEPPPSLDNVERGLRQLLESMLPPSTTRHNSPAVPCRSVVSTRC